MRLDKFLAENGLGSRAQVKQVLKKGLVLVNGRAEKSPKAQIDERTDEIVVSGQKLNYEHFVYYLLNKPQGVISATEDERHQTVLDLLDETARRKAVFPVGRLDIDTHGLLLLTNNGKLAHAMLSPKRHVAKVYHAQIAGMMDEQDAERFAAGIKLKDFSCQPSRLEILEVSQKANSSRVRIT
ncbi:pseudouridine synthase, partial [Streptococcus sp. DD11]